MLERFRQWILRRFPPKEVLLPIIQYIPDEIRGETRLYRKEVMTISSSVFGSKSYWKSSFLGRSIDGDLVRWTTFLRISDFEAMPQQESYDAQFLCAKGLPLGFLLKIEVLSDDGTITTTEEETRPFHWHHL